jgi:glutamate/tyrosine decarboxylase-like PLP-dependent enzyme
MSAALLGGDEHVVGNMTSGGTESLLMAVVTARQWARANRPQITAPEMILPNTAHPAFDKAAHYFGVKAVKTPVGADFRADVEACRAALTPQTILIVGSAPSYPQGVVDPISGLAQIARENDILCHVDACVGGFMLPFVQRLGYPAPDFDFRVAGVTSISADLHKYGYAAKGASVILYRTPELRRHQFFVATDWPGGVYASPALAGTRPGGAIAAAWAVMNYLGEEGYLRITKTVMETVQRLQAGIRAIPGLYILGEPEMSVMAIGSQTLNIYEVGDEMSLRGWHMDRQQFPACLHLTVNYAHTAIVDQFLSDLAEAAKRARRPTLHKIGNSLTLGLARAAVKILPEKTVSRLMGRATPLVGGSSPSPDGRTAALYGLMGTLPNRGDLRELVMGLIDSFTRSETKN